MIAGWAYDESAPSRHIEVSILLYEVPLISAIADARRDDLVEAKVGDGCHAFTVPFPQPIKPEQFPHLLALAEGQPIPIHSSWSPNAPFLKGSVDCLDTDGVAGWVCTQAALNHSVAVSVLLGDRLLAQTDANLLRPDLVSANIGSGHYGFRVPFQETIDETELAKIVIRAGGLELQRALLLEPFHATLPPLDSPASRKTLLFKVSVRNVFEMTSNSVMARLTRMMHNAIDPDPSHINPILNDICQAVRSNSLDTLHAEKLKVSFPGRIEEVEISRTNTHFESLDRTILEYRAGYEPEILACIDVLVPDDGIFFDIGSNWGYFSLSLAARGRFAGKIHAFEPSSQSFPDLAKLVEKMALTNCVTCHKLALSDLGGSARLSLGLITGLSSISETVAENWGHDFEEVAVARLDDLTLPPPNLVKIDVEGVEANVLRGGEICIARARPAIVFENWLFPNQMAKTLEPLEILEAADYELFLPCWFDSDRHRFSSVPTAAVLNQRFALRPFEAHQRPMLDERLNVLALPKGRAGQLSAEEYLADDSSLVR